MKSSPSDIIVVNDKTEKGITIPSFGKSKESFVDLTATYDAEAAARSMAIKNVNPVTFPDLEITITRAYQELRRNHAMVGFLLAEAERMAESAKADAMLDKYPDFIKEKPKSFDNADMRKSFLTRDTEYQNALERIDMLKATESMIDGKIKVMEKLSMFMRKQMDLLIRSGLSGASLYVTSGKK